MSKEESLKILSGRLKEIIYKEVHEEIDRIKFFAYCRKIIEMLWLDEYEPTNIVSVPSKIGEREKEIAETLIALIDT